MSSGAVGARASLKELASLRNTLQSPYQFLLNSRVRKGPFFRIGIVDAKLRKLLELPTHTMFAIVIIVIGCRVICQGGARRA